MKRLLIVGASEKQIPIIQRAREMGNYVICIDGNPDSIGYQYSNEFKTIDINNYEECMRFAREKHIDGVATLSSTATLPTVNYIAEKMNLVGNPYVISEMLKDKYLIKKILKKNNCNISGKYFKINSLEDVDSIKRYLRYPLVSKPCDGSASKGVNIIKKREDLMPCLEDSMKCSRISSIYLEEYIEGEEYSVESFVKNGEIIVLGIIKTTMRQERNGLLDYGHSTPSGLSEEIEKDIENEVKTAIKALEIKNGSVNMDIIIRNSTPYIIDLGPRIGLNLIASHIIPYSTGFHEIDNTVKLSLGEKVEANVKYKKPVATRLLIMKPGTIKHITSYNAILNDENVLEIIFNKKQGDTVKPYRTKSDTCGWIICTGKTPDEANKIARKYKRELDRLIEID